MFLDDLFHSFDGDCGVFVCEWGGGCKSAEGVGQGIGESVEGPRCDVARVAVDANSYDETEGWLLKCLECI